MSLFLAPLDWYLNAIMCSRKLQYSQPSGHTSDTPPLISTSSRPQASESEAATVTKALSRHRKSLLD